MFKFLRFLVTVNTQWDDPAILERAELEACIVLTLDKNFAQIARQRRIPLKRSGVAYSVSIPPQSSAFGRS